MPCKTTYGGLVFFGCLKTGDSRPWRGSMRVLRAGSKTIHENSSAPTPFDPLCLFESREIVIDRGVRICVEVVLGVWDLTVWGLQPKVLWWSPREGNLPWVKRRGINSRAILLVARRSQKKKPHSGGIFFWLPGTDSNRRQSG